MAAPGFQPMSVGQIFDRTFSLYRQNLVRFITIVSVVTVPVWLVQFGGAYVLRRGFGAAAGGALGVALIALSLFAVLVGMLAQNLSNAALLRSVSESYLGHEVTVGEAYRMVLPRLVTIVVAGILVGIVVMFGMILLIVPGIIFALWFSLTTPAIVLEDLGATAGMGRSRRLVSGNLGKVFGVGFIAVIIALIIGYLFGFLGSFVASRLGDVNDPGYLLVSQLFSLAGQIASTPISATATILLYYDLRIRKEGFDLEMLTQRLGSRENASDA
jgi:hypothetical protein